MAEPATAAPKTAAEPEIPAAAPEPAAAPTAPHKPAPPVPSRESANAAEQLIAVGERAGAAVRSTLHAIAARRGMALTVIGAAVFALAWISERDSAWGFPMLIGGLAMIGLGLIGPRLSGSMALRWGDDGAHFHLSSTVAPPGQRHRAPALPASVERETGPHPVVAKAAIPEPASGSDLVPPSEIEGQAETIEFSVENLKS